MIALQSLVGAMRTRVGAGGGPRRGVAIPRRGDEDSCGPGRAARGRPVAIPRRGDEDLGTVVSFSVKASLQSLVGAMRTADLVALLADALDELQSLVGAMR